MNLTLFLPTLTPTHVSVIFLLINIIQGHFLLQQRKCRTKSIASITFPFHVGQPDVYQFKFIYQHIIQSCDRILKQYKINKRKWPDVCNSLTCAIHWACLRYGLSCH